MFDTITSTSTIQQKLQVLQADCEDRGNYTARAENASAHKGHAVDFSGHYSELLQADIYFCHTCEVAGIHVSEPIPTADEVAAQEGFTVTLQTHQDCPTCEAQAPLAITMARVTGSIGSTHTTQNPSGISHSATVVRAL